MEMKCEELVDKELRKEIDTFKILWKNYCLDPEKYDDDYGTLDEYGLWFDYIPAGYHEGQKEAYFIYQLSTGGPGDEFRFFTNPDYSVHRIEYWYLDWFDGAHKVLEGEDFDLMDEIFEMYFKESGTCEYRFQKAMED
jgi:hypothetical protein